MEQNVVAQNHVIFCLRFNDVMLSVFLPLILLINNTTELLFDGQQSIMLIKNEMKISHCTNLLIFCFSFCCLFVPVSGIKSRALCIVNKHSNPELHRGPNPVTSVMLFRYL